GEKKRPNESERGKRGMEGQRLRVTRRRPHQTRRVEAAKVVEKEADRRRRRR
ncbi:hypothetical protein X777_12528, partial [Ooceraea biroi]